MCLVPTPEPWATPVGVGFSNLPPRSHQVTMHTNTPLNHKHTTLHVPRCWWNSYHTGLYRSPQNLNEKLHQHCLPVQQTIHKFAFSTHFTTVQEVHSPEESRLASSSLRLSPTSLHIQQPPRRLHSCCARSSTHCCVSLHRLPLRATLLHPLPSSARPPQPWQQS